MIKALIVFSLAFASTSARASVDATKLGREDGMAYAKAFARELVDEACKYKLGGNQFSAGFIARDELRKYYGTKCTEAGAERMAAQLKAGQLEASKTTEYLDSYKKVCDGNVSAFHWAYAKSAVQKAACQRGFGNFYGAEGASVRARQYCEESMGRKASRPEILKLADLGCEVMILKRMVAETKGHMSEDEVADFLTESFRKACKATFGKTFVKVMNKVCGAGLKKARGEGLDLGHDSKDAPSVGRGQKSGPSRGGGQRPAD